MMIGFRSTALLSALLLSGCAAFEAAKLLTPAKDGIDATVQVGKENKEAHVMAEVPVEVVTTTTEQHEVMAEAYTYRSEALPWYVWAMLIMALLISSPFDKFFGKKKEDDEPP